MKIKLYGSRCQWCQVPRIEQGFIEIGYETTNNAEEADLLYSNDEGGYKECLEDGEKFNKKTVLTVLDVPEHLPNLTQILEKWKPILSKASIVTSICKTTQFQLKNWLGLDSEIIYQPVMPITQVDTSGYKQYEFLLAGRTADPVKRSYLLYNYLKKYNKPMSSVAVVGPEFCGFGEYYGLLSLEELNILYNCCEYLFCGTVVIGMQLPVIEKFLTKSGFPLVMSDSNVAKEFAPEFACYPSDDGISIKLNHIQNNLNYYSDIRDKYAELYKVQFDPKSVAARIIEATEK